MQIPSFVPHYNILALFNIGNGHREGERFVYDLSPAEVREHADLLAKFQCLFTKGAWFGGVPNAPHIPWRKVLRVLDRRAIMFLRKTCVKDGRYWVLPKNRLLNWAARG